MQRGSRIENGRTERVNLLLTESEKVKLDKAVKKSRLTLSAYIRKCCGLER